MRINSKRINFAMLGTYIIEETLTLARTCKGEI